MRSSLRGLIILLLLLSSVIGRSADASWLKGYAKTIAGETILAKFGAAA